MVVVVGVIVVVSAVAGTRCHRRTMCRQWALCVVAGGCVSSITSLGVSLRPGGKVGVVSEGYRKMDHENEPQRKRRGSCFVTHNWGLPLHALFSLPESSVKRDLAAHIPLKRGGTARVASSLVRKLRRC